MNLTNEQIDALIAALQAAKTKAPIELWVVLDCDGYACTYKTAEMAEMSRAESEAEGSYGPYTLHHMREVLP